MADLDELMKDYRELANEVRLIVGKHHGFALLLKLEDGNYHYASNADRADVRKTLAEWLGRVGVANARDPGESRTRAKARLQLEARCAEVGRLIDLCGLRHVLFVFDFGERGSLAWHANAPNPRDVVQAFLDMTAEKDG